VARPPRQRWRLTFARAHDPSQRTHREIADEWLRAIEASGLPLPVFEAKRRSPLTFGAPMPAGIACREELADLALADVLPAWRVRELLEGTLPDGLRLLRLNDVWVGAVALAAAIRAADYRIALEDPTSVEAIADACRELLATRTLEREKAAKPGATRDIRPLIADVRVDRAGMALLIQTRFDPERGVGRPDEVLAALEELAGPIARAATVRERLILDERA
jgi:radical SAM-linked protein